MGSELYNLINRDCMEFLRECEDNQFDLLIADVPYGIQTKKLTGFKKDDIHGLNNKKCQKWDKLPDKEYFDQVFRVCKHQIIWGAQYFTKYLPNFSQPIVWNKKTGKNKFADGELAYCSIKGTMRIFEHQWCGVFKDSERGVKAIHPNQKPVALYKWLLDRYAKKGWSILDTHLGSGSSAIACHDYDYDFTGIEADEKIYDDAVKRCLTHASQMRFAL